MLLPLLRKKVSARIFLHFAPCLAKFTREEDKLHISDALDQVINAQAAGVWVWCVWCVCVCVVGVVGGRGWVAPEARSNFKLFLHI